MSGPRSPLILCTEGEGIGVCVRKRSETRRLKTLGDCKSYRPEGQGPVGEEVSRKLLNRENFNFVSFCFERDQLTFFSK